MDLWTWEREAWEIYFPRQNDCGGIYRSRQGASPPKDVFEKMGGAEMSAPKRAGDRGERAVAAFLERRGYTLLDRQWRCRQGELDLVALDGGGTLCFVEVKLRGSGAIGLPREFVDSRKQSRLRAAAACYLSARALDVPARFDVAEVYEEADGALRITYLEDAFI